MSLKKREWVLSLKWLAFRRKPDDVCISRLSERHALSQATSSCLQEEMYRNSDFYVEFFFYWRLWAVGRFATHFQVYY